MIQISVRSNWLQATKELTSFARDQVPYATARALTALAIDVQQAEKQSLAKTFDRPTPFTVNSIRVIPAKKNLWVSTVFVMDIAAQYLYPYETQGMHKLIGRGVTWLSPRDKSMLNQYGNFPARTLQRYVGTAKIAGAAEMAKKKGLKPLPGKKGYFIGTVHGKKGNVGGLWKRVAGPTGKKGRGLKLLIRFGESHPARQHLDFVKRAEQVVQTNFNKRFGEALARAIATA